MDIDNMTPDELRRALRDALAMVEEMKKRLDPQTHSGEYELTKTSAGYRIVDAHALWRGT